eukprot:GHVL01040947.1.p1 GENE.GHVL01040947.1~~GHVL01040947.1.p1  ORF type:complete len:292 (+),score=65.65 GHVL01040947.1:402-1277(+)
MKFIETQNDFDEICEKFQCEAVLYMDTEFVRQRTYYATLSLVQIACSQYNVIIDVLSRINIKKLKYILANENILKVFHAPDQDFDIFLHIFGELPRNVFDSQTAASVIGIGDMAGYGKLCKELLNIDLDKTMQKSNWLLRPLSHELLDYAIKDVEYLIPLHHELSKILTEKDLWDIYKNKSQKLLNIDTYDHPPEKLIKKINLKGHSDEFCKNLLPFIQLREECAQKLDLPRNFCATDNDLIKICKDLPVTSNALYMLSIKGKPITKNKFKQKLLNICLEVKKNPGSLVYE